MGHSGENPGLPKGAAQVKLGHLEQKGFGGINGFRWVQCLVLPGARGGVAETVSLSQTPGHRLLGKAEGTPC